MFHAHLGWLFDRRQTNAERYAPDLLKDDGLRGHQPAVQLLGVPQLRPAGAHRRPGHRTAGRAPGRRSSGPAWCASALLHHVTWSINSVCHVVGNRPFVSARPATNFWPLAILSVGESWHNLHHADPTCARHGVLRGQIDISARVIWLFEKLGWARDVKWPDPVRLAAKRASGPGRVTS